MKYIALESIEGGGKGTAIYELRKLLPDAVFVREPGGTPNAERIRSIAIGENVDDEPLNPISELLLFMAARVELLTNIVKPALDAGKTVISDRSFYSTIAYQGQTNPNEVKLLVDDVICPIAEPRYVIYLDVDVETSRLRASRRGALDSIEMRDDSFFKQARDRYLTMCRTHPEVFFKVDATRTREEVFADICAILRQIGVELPTL